MTDRLVSFSVLHAPKLLRVPSVLVWVSAVIIVVIVISPAAKNAGKNLTHPSSHIIQFCREGHQGASFLHSPATFTVNTFYKYFFVAIPRTNRKKLADHRGMKRTLCSVKLAEYLIPLHYFFLREC